jgi:cbb3-type cytochrome oxidase cytochrome c subunit
LTSEVPFVLVNEISPEPWGFDNLESINRTILDLESVSRQNFYNSVFAQMYLPSSCLDTVMAKFNCNAEVAATKLFGFNFPILIDKEDTVPGYIMPDASSLVTIRGEIKDLKKELYDSVGLALQAETKQVASAESKAWDHLDIEQVMKERAEVLQEAEEKCIKISNAWDSDFPVYQPVYNKKFDVEDFRSEMETLVLAGNVSMPDEMTRVILRKMFNKLVKGEELSSEENQTVLDAIDNFTNSLSITPVPSSNPVTKPAISAGIK